MAEEQKDEQKVYMPLMIGDWLKGTRGMKAEVKGVYISLLLYQWDNGYVPSDWEELCLIDPELPKVWDKLKSKFPEISPGKLQNKKNKEVRDFWSKQRNNGSKGGRPRRKTESKTQTVTQNETQTQTINNDNDLDKGIKTKKYHEEKLKVACAVCSIFGKHYLLPDERLPQTANWFRTIDQQVDKLLEVWKPDEAVKQILAYIRHCDDTGRKRVATDYKVAETLFSVNWIGIAAPDPVPKDSNPYAEAEHNRKLWTEEAWRKQYASRIKTDAGFREYFKLQTTQ